MNLAETCNLPAFADQLSQLADIGWLSLQRRCGESLILEGAEGESVTVTLERTDPLTIRLDLPGIGPVDLSFCPRRGGARVALRADRTVAIRRAELERCQECP